MTNNLDKWAQKIIEPTGIKINGSNPWDIKVINPNFYNRVKAQGSLGLGESYMDGGGNATNWMNFLPESWLTMSPVK